MRRWVVYWCASLIVLELAHAYAPALNLPVVLVCVFGGIAWLGVPRQKDAPSDRP